MKTEILIRQHLYTGTMRRFETIARSPDIGRDEGREIENRAGSFSYKATDGYAPLLFRGFPLSVSERDFSTGIMLLCYLDNDPSGRGGNYMAHSFLIETEQLRRCGWNVAWIATHLPIWDEFQPALEIVELAPLSVQIDPQEQYRFLQLVMDEIGREATTQIMEHILLKVGKSADAILPLQLPFKPLPGEREWESISGRILSEGDASIPVPTLDVLNIWRLAGIMSVLPPIFQKYGSFSINDATIPSKYALTVLWEAPSETLPSVDVSPYLEYCMNLVTQEQFDEIDRLKSWMEKPLKTPSTDALNICLLYYNKVVRFLEAGGKPDVTAWSTALNDIRSCIESVFLGMFEDDLTACVGKDVLNGPERAELLMGFSVLVDLGDYEPGQGLVDMIVEWLAMEALQNLDGAWMLFERLRSIKIRERIWEASEKQEKLPARVSPTERYEVLSRGMRFAFSVYAAVYRRLSAEQRTAFEKNICECCWAKATTQLEHFRSERLPERFVSNSERNSDVTWDRTLHQRDVMPVYTRGLENVMAHAFSLILEVPPSRGIESMAFADIRPVFISNIVKKLHDESILTGERARLAVVPLFNRYIFPNKGLIPANAAAEMVVALNPFVGGAIEDVVTMAVSQAHLGYYIEVVRGITETIQNSMIREFAKVRGEYLSALMNGPKKALDRKLDVVVPLLPRFERWISDVKSKGFYVTYTGEARRQLNDRLMAEIVQNTTLESALVPALTLAISYFNHFTGNDSLFEAVVTRMISDTRQVSGWLLNRNRRREDANNLNRAYILGMAIRGAAARGSESDELMAKTLAGILKDADKDDAARLWEDVQRYTPGLKKSRMWRRLFCGNDGKNISRGILS